MKLVNVFLMFLVLCSSLIAQKNTIAVLEMEGSNIDGGYVKILTGNLIGELAKSNHIRVLERTRIDLVMQEVGLISSGLTATNDSVAKIGKIAGAEYILLSSIGRIGSVYSINLRVVNVENAQNAQSVSVSDNCDRNELHLLVKRAANELLYKMTGEEFASFSKGGIVTRSIFFPGWGQLNGNRYFRGSVYSVAFAASLTMIYLSWQNYNDEYDSYDKLKVNFNNEQDLVKKSALADNLNDSRKKIEKQSDNFDLFAYTAAGIYLLNFIDALAIDATNPAYQSYSLTPFLDNRNNKQVGLKLSINL